MRKAFFKIKEVLSQMQKKIVRRTTLLVAAGTAALTAVMLAVYAALDKWTLAVLLGALLGVLYAAVNFYLRSVTQVKAVSKPSAAAAKHAATLSYTLRMLAMMGLAVLGFVTRWYDGVAFLLPQVFAQAFTFFYYFIMLKKEARTAAAGTQNADGAEPEQEA